jgi:hypothetical protein
VDYIVIDGDLAIFEPNFGAALVGVRPVALRGSGPATLGGKPSCVAGDEAAVTAAGCAYTTPTHLTPGSGTLAIAALAGDQRARKTYSGRAQLLLVGGRFSATFTVQAPALDPSSGAPDTMPEYRGQGRFVSVNTRVRGT